MRSYKGKKAMVSIESLYFKTVHALNNIPDVENNIVRGMGVLPSGSLLKLKCGKMAQQSPGITFKIDENNTRAAFK